MSAKTRSEAVDTLRRILTTLASNAPLASATGFRALDELADELERLAVASEAGPMPARGFVQ